MLLNAIIFCCMIVANAEPPLNSYSLTGDSNGYDYSNIVNNNGYLGSKDSYQNGGNFYNAGDINHKLANHVGSHSLINAGNQDSIGSDMGNNYNGYSTSDHGGEYAGYSNTYENTDSDSYTSPTRATSFKGYLSSNNNGESIFDTYSSGTVHKDSNFGQYAAGSSSSSQRVPSYSAYSRPTVENYSEGSADSGDIQGYRDSSGSSSYSENDQAYSSYSQGGPISEYLFGKQKDGLHNLKGGNKYSGIYSIPSETRYARGNAGHMSHNRDVPPYMSGSGSSNHFSKIHGSGIYSSGKPSKYGYKYLSRYAPNNNGLIYLSRERDGYYIPYGKGNGKIIIIKDSRPSYNGHVHSDEQPYASNNGGYRGKNGGFMSGYSNFDGYSGSSRSYDDNPTLLRRYRTSGGPMLLQKKTMYS